MAMALSSTDDNEISYVLPVLGRTSCFVIMGPKALGNGSINVRAVVNTRAAAHE